MCEPLAVDIFTDKNKKDPPSAHVSSVFVLKLQELFGQPSTINLLSQRTVKGSF